MPDSHPEPGASWLKRCPSCGRPNAARMVRCLYCGAGLQGAAWQAPPIIAEETPLEPGGRKAVRVRVGLLALIALGACIPAFFTWNYIRLVSAFLDGQGGVPEDGTEVRWVEVPAMEQVFGGLRLRPPTFWESVQISFHTGPFIIVVLLAFMAGVILWYRRITR